MRQRNRDFDVRVSWHHRPDVGNEDLFGFLIEATTKRAYASTERASFRTVFVDADGSERFPAGSNDDAAAALKRHDPQRPRPNLQSLAGFIDEVVETRVPSRRTPHAWVVRLLAEDPHALLAFADTIHGAPWRAAFVRILDLSGSFRWADRYRLIESGLDAEFRSDLVPLVVERPRPHLARGPEGVHRLIPQGVGSTVEFEQGVESMAVPDTRWLTVADALVQDGGTVTSGGRLVCYEEASDPSLRLIGGVAESNFGSAAHPEGMLLARHHCADFEIGEAILLGGRNDFNWHHWLAAYLPRVLTIPDSVAPDVPVLISGGTPSGGIEALRELTDRPIVMLDAQKSQPVGRLHVAAPLVQVSHTGSWDWAADTALDRGPLDALRDRWNASVPRKGQGRRVFLHRRSARRAVVNESELVKVAEHAGFEVIDPDRMTFAEQRRLYGETELLVGASEAVGANILMMRPGSVILAFTPEHLSDFVLPAALSTVAECEFRYLVGRSEIAPTTDLNRWLHADHRIDGEALASVLADMAGIDSIPAVLLNGRASGKDSRERPHICLAARGGSPVEHLGAIARQAREIDLDVCWLAFFDQPETAHWIRRHADPDAIVIDVADEAVLAEHLSSSGSVAVWVQYPYHEAYPEWFWSAAKNRVAYANYGLTLSAGWDDGRYGLDTYRDAAWLVTEAPAEKQGYVAHGVRPERIVCAGNPLLAELRARDSRVESRAFDLLWAPHWSDQGFVRLAYSRWREAVHAILAYAREHPESQLLFRPHPRLLYAVVETLPADDVAASALRQFEELPNVTVSAATLVDDIVASKALITDGISIIAYWAATGRPLGVTRDEESGPFNAAGQAILATADVLSTPNEIAAWLSKLPDATVNEERRALSARLHPTFDETPIALWNGHRLGRLSGT